MSGKLWLNKGKAVLDKGKAVVCNQCPCGLAYWVASNRYSSVDGINYIGIVLNANALAFNGKIWVSVGNSVFGYSSDGVRWSGGFINLYSWSVIWDGVKFVAAGYSVTGDVQSAAIATSVDGISWTLTLLPYYSFSGICFNGNFYVISGYNRPVEAAIPFMLRSYDLSSFEMTGVSYLYPYIATSGTRLVAVTHNSGRAIASDSGTEWEEFIIGGGSQTIGCSWVESLFIASLHKDDNSFALITSPTGEIWTERTTLSQPAYSTAWNGEMAVASNKYSENLIDWYDILPIGTYTRFIASRKAPNLFPPIGV